MKGVMVMTQYCNRCCLPFDGECCPVCGKKNAKQIRSNDLCFLTEKEQLWSGVLADVLNQQKIPFVQKNVFGTGMAMKTGLMNERVRFYVFYGYLAEAKKIADELFSSFSEENDNED